MLIRPATFDDLEAINDIYNQSISTYYSTCDTLPISIEDRNSWFKEHDPLIYPVFVYEASKQVIGWISLSAYRKGRQALDKTVEVSYFIDKNFQNMGIGSQLLHHTLIEAKRLGYKNIFAILLEKNIASIALLEKFKFKKWAHLPKVAVINGTVLDQYYFGLNYYE